MIGYHLGTGWRAEEMEGWRGKRNASLTQTAKQRRIKAIAWDALTCKSNKFGFPNGRARVHHHLLWPIEEMMRQDRHEPNMTLITEW